MRGGRQKDAFLQNTLPRNIITIKKIWFFFFFYFFFVRFSFSYCLGFPIDILHFLPPENRAVAHKNLNKYVT